MTEVLERQQYIATLLMKLRARDDIGELEERALAEAISGTREVAAGKLIVPAGVLISESILLIDGIVSRYKDLPNGERQIQELHVTGDFVDLHGFLLKRLDHNVAAITDCLIATVPHERLTRITQELPHLTRMLWFSTVLDASIQRETILSIGRRDALSRIAHLMCELCARLGVAGQCDEHRFRLALTQTDIADATGLTSVHVNRMLKQLREQDLLTFRNGEVQIHDWDGLARVAQFDGEYLHLERIPR